MLEHSWYHKILRVTVVLLAVIVSFKSGLFSDTTKRLAVHTEWYLANAVAVQVGVAETDVNRLTGRITQLETELSNQSERSLNIGLAAGGTTDRSTFILSGILFIMLVLIVLNYALDYARTRDPQKVPTKLA
jgi:hypothetical protein